VAPFEASELAPGVGVLLPEKVWPVVGAAMRLQCETLVTGDRTHFGALYRKTVNGVSIHSPRSLAEAVLTRER
jgi:hypothetical protein